MKLYYEHVLNEPEQSFRTEVYAKRSLTGRYHCHPEYELTWIEEGGGLRIIGFTIETFSAGDLVLIPPMLPHHYMTRNSGFPAGGTSRIRYRVLKFRRELLAPLFELPEFNRLKNRLAEAENTGMCFGGGGDDLAPVAALFCKICDGEGIGRFLAFLALLARLAETPARLLEVSRCAVCSDSRIVRVIAFLHREMERGHAATLVEAARCGCMTAPAFSSYFRKTTGKRFIDYLTEIKLGRALNLLVKSDMNISEIALASGFRNLSNFNRAFLAGRRMTPSAYRRKMRSIAGSAATG